MQTAFSAASVASQNFVLCKVGKNDLELDYRNALLRVGMTETGGYSAITGIACLPAPCNRVVQ